MTATTGIHHITAITADPQKNLDFYEGFLGQRMVKKTVNFDDPNAYHLYYGDYVGSPGTLVTFFYWAGMPRGEQGTGEVTAFSYRINPQSVAFWKQRCIDFQVEAYAQQNDFGEDMIEVRDPDGIIIELIAAEGVPAQPWSDGIIPVEHALQGFYSAILFVHDLQSIEPLLVDGLGYEKIAEAVDTVRFATAQQPGRYLDVKVEKEIPRAAQGAGSVHHIAFQAADDTQRSALKEQVDTLGVDSTGLVDRQYFHSTYFMTPASILFEIATTDIGFTVDEALVELGENLSVPPQYEEFRSSLEANLQPLTLPRNNPAKFGKL